MFTNGMFVSSLKYYSYNQDQILGLYLQQKQTNKLDVFFMCFSVFRQKH